jgi:hypothetical protein
MQGGVTSERPLSEHQFKGPRAWRRLACLISIPLNDPPASARCNTTMTQIISIAPTGLIAYECPRCGHLISVIDPAKDDRSALSRAGRMAVDAWERAADCARAIEASKDPTRRALVGTLQKLWIELGNNNGC